VFHKGNKTKYRPQKKQATDIPLTRNYYSKSCFLEIFKECSNEKKSTRSISSSSSWCHHTLRPVGALQSFSNISGSQLPDWCLHILAQDFSNYLHSIIMKWSYFDRILCHGNNTILLQHNTHWLNKKNIKLDQKETIT